MKMISKNGLFLAGIIYLLSIITSFTENSFINILYDISLLVWLCLVILMLFNKLPFPVTSLINKFPKITTYIASFGVLTYFWVFYTLFILILGFSTDINENSFIAPALTWFAKNTPIIILFTTISALVISFLIIHTKKKTPN